KKEVAETLLEPVHGNVPTKTFSNVVSIDSKRSNTPAEKAKPNAPALRLTHPDKVVDPESGVTKRQLMDYLWIVSDAMLPHIADRPLSLVRCPEGSMKQCFYQKHV
ncbi:MAG: ATP-dependent DNA ligase, partial [Terriglobus sp.]